MSDAVAALLAAAPVAALAIDGAGVCVLANDPAAARFGEPAAAFVGRPVSALLAAGDGTDGLPGAPFPGWPEAAAAGWEGTLVPRTGGRAPLAARVVPLPGEAGRATLFLTDADPAPAPGLAATGEHPSARGTAVVMTWRVDPAGANAARLTFVGPQVADMLGYSPEEALAESGFLRNHTHPADAARVHAAAAQAVARRAPFREEYRLRTRDGRWLWVRDESLPVLADGADGPLAGWQGVLIDVTEQKAAEARLRASEARFRALTEHGSDLTAVFDAAGVWRYVGVAAERILGYRPEELVGRPYDAVDHPEDAAASRAVFDRLAAEPDRVERFEQRVVRKDGTVRWLEIIGHNRLADPAVGGVVMVGRDVTERREAEDRLRSLLDHLPAVVYVARADDLGETTYVSPAIEDLLGVRPDAWTVDPGRWLRQVCPEDRERVLAAVAQAADGGRMARIEYRFVAADGRTVWVRDEAVRAPDGRGGFVWQGFLLDITERKDAEERLRESEERHRTLLERLPAIVAVNAADETNATLYASPRVAEVFGDRPADLVADPRLWMARVHPDDRARLEAEIARANRAGDAFVLEYRRFARDGREVWVRDEGRLARDDAGRPLRWESVITDITDRKLAEERLRESEERYRRLVEQLPAAVSINALDARWSTLYVSPQIEAMLGHPPERYLADPDLWQEQIHPEDRAAAVAGMARAAAAGEARPIEYRFVRPDGRVVWIRDESVLVRDGEGRPLHWQAVLTDVTDQKRTEADLRAAEAHARTLLERLPVLVYVQDHVDPHRLEYANPQTSALFGYDQDEWAATWLERLHPDDRERVRAEVDRTTAVGRPFRSEYREQTADGRYLWVRDEAVLVADDPGHPPYWLGVKLDITERVEAEHRLRESEDRYRALVEQIPAAVYLLAADEAQTPLYFSPRIADLQGTTVEEALARRNHWLDLIHPDDRAAVAAEDARTNAVAEPFRMEYRQRGANGGWTWVRDESAPVFGDDGRVVAWQGLLIDVSDRHRLEDELRAARDAAEEASRLKSQFLSTISHELRTPLNAIVGYSHLLLDGMAGPLSAAQSGDVAQIAGAADRLLTLVDDVLDLSRVESGHLELAREPVDLVALAERVRDLLAPLTEHKGIALEVEAEPDAPPALGDADRLRQVLLNLIGNAVKFTDAGEVRVRVAAVPGAGPADAALEVVVSDTGIGIAPEALPHIFDEFRQADGSTTRRYGGTGLGLAIVRRLVDLHGGTIRAESEPGVGSTFTVTLPAGES